MIQRLLLAATAAIALSCDPGPVEHPDPPFVQDLPISPSAIHLHPGQSRQFVVADSSVTAGVSWSVVDGPGTITETGLYTVPAGAISDTLRFFIEARTAARFGRSRVTIVPGDDAPLCFERDVQPIIRANCALSGCHDPGGLEGGYDFTTYAGVRQAVVPGSPEASIMVLKITHEDEHERMPPDPRLPLSEGQIETITHWIADGAIGAPCPGDAPCDTAGVTFGGTVRPILAESCIGCHSPGGPGSSIDLGDYDGVRAVALSGQLYGSITHAHGYAPMPGPSSSLDACSIRQIRKWIDRGAPND